MDSTCFGRFEPMDLIGFSSWSGCGVAINLCSLGIPFYHLSHVGIVARHPDHPWPLLCESTNLYRKPCMVQDKLVDGVQWHKIGPRIRSYKGLVYHYQVRVPLTPGQQSMLSQFLKDMTGRSYDAFGALGARDTLLGWLARRGKVADLVSLFCSELVAAAGRKCGVYPQSINASGFSPNRIIRKSVLCWKTHFRPRWIKRCPCPGSKRDSPCAG